jgi:arginine deiminase
MSIEGGDVLVLSEQVVCIGCSQRTDAYAIETVARRLFASDSGFTHVVAVQIPHVRSFMHLDTVLTMLDRDKFLVYSQYFGLFESCYHGTRGKRRPSFPQRRKPHAMF